MTFDSFEADAAIVTRKRLCRASKVVSAEMVKGLWAVRNASVLARNTQGNARRRVSRCCTEQIRRNFPSDFQPYGYAPLKSCTAFYSTEQFLDTSSLIVTTRILLNAMVSLLRFVDTFFDKHH